MQKEALVLTLAQEGKNDREITKEAVASLNRIKAVTGEGSLP